MHPVWVMQARMNVLAENSAHPIAALFGAANRSGISSVGRAMDRFETERAGAVASSLLCGGWAAGNKLDCLGGPPRT